MRVNAPSTLRLALTLSLLAPMGEALADPITPWPGERTATGTLQLVPILYVAGDANSAYPSLYASTGIGDSWDVYVGVWGIASRELKGFDYVDVFPRYHLSEETAVALRLQLTPGESLVVGGELHTNFTWDKVSLMINTGVRPEFGLTTGALDAATVFAMVAPEYHFTDQFSVYFEVNPALTTYAPLSQTGDSALGTELALLPGLSYALDPEETQQFSVGAELALRRGEAFSLGNSITFAAWYAVSFDLTGGGEASSEEAAVPARAARSSRRLGRRSGLGAIW